MSFRTIEVKLKADVGSFTAGMGAAAASVRDFGRQVSGMGSASTRDIERVGRSALVMSGTLAVGLGASAKAAIDWESAWAGVAKTVDGSAEQMSALQGELREMTTQLPATHGEIAAVAEAAGALGVETASIGSFTRTMIDLGETTNLTADQAATSFARIANVMGTSQSDFDRMGSTIVALGNAGASTEAEIAEMAQRLAAAGTIAGLSEADVFAFAESLAAVGVEAEAGGTAFSKVFTSIRDAVLDGSDKLQVFAQTAGMSISEFSALFREDAAEAIVSFVEGLGDVSAAGQSTTAIFDDLGLADQRLMRALLATGEASDYVRHQVLLANGAWDENTALMTEAEKRYETTAAKLEVARNQVVDLGVDIGGVLLPAVAKAADGASNLIRGFSEMPSVLKVAGTGVAGISATLTGIVGTTGVLLPKIRDLRTSLREMGAAGRVAATAMPWLAGAGAAIAVSALAYERATRASREYEAQVRELARSLSPVLDGQTSLNDALAEFLRLGVEGLSSEQVEGLNAFGVSLADIEDTIVAGGDALDPFRAQIQALGLDLEGFDIGKLDDKGASARAVDRVAEAMGISRTALKGLIEEIEDWDDEAQGAAQRTIELAVTNGDLTQSAVDAAVEMATLEDGTINWAAALQYLIPEVEGTSGAMRESVPQISSATEAIEQQEQAIDDLISELDELFEKYFGFEEARDKLLRGFNELDDVMTRAIENGLNLRDVMGDQSDGALILREHMRGMTAGAKGVIDEWIRQGVRGQELQARIDYLSQSFRDQAEAAGVPAPVVDHYLGLLDEIPNRVDTAVNANTVQATAAIDALISKFAELQRSVPHVRIPISSEADLRALVGESRWGDIYEYARGGVTPAHIARGDLIRYAEPETGGEAFIPRRGDPTRSMSILATAASWYGARVVPMANGGVGRFAGGTHGEVPSGFELTQVMHQVGAISDTDFRRHLQVRLTQFRQYSAEWVDAYQQLLRFEEDAEADRARIQEEAARDAEDDYRHRREINDNLFELGKISLEDHLFNLDRRMAREVKYSDAWMGLHNERERLLEEQKRLTEERAEAERRAVDDAVEALNDLLDAEADIHARMEQATTEHHARLRAMEADLERDRRDAIAGRARALQAWIGVEERAVISWGNTVGALTSNIADQAQVFTDWQDQLAAARARGVSQGVIEALGLDESPQALGQLRMFAAATDEEIAALNEAVAARNEQAGAQARAEAQQSYTALGGMLVDMRSAFAAEVEALNEEFLAEQARLTGELALVGADQGRSYGDAIAAGITSAVPAIREAAQAARDAMGGVVQLPDAGTPVRLNASAAVPDTAAMAAAVQRLRQPALQIRADVYLDGKRIVDDRVKVVIRDMNTDAEIAGAH